MAGMAGDSEEGDVFVYAGESTVEDGPLVVSEASSISEFSSISELSVVADTAEWVGWMCSGLMGPLMLLAILAVSIIEGWKKGKKDAAQKEAKKDSADAPPADAPPANVPPANTGSE
ncbi:MAG: hypothetical protein M1821_001855 [Bathelium mastoideum]|nr:MAG: hypothetical protein M1821_001855 [Bathelium mastoideum]